MRKVRSYESARPARGDDVVGEDLGRAEEREHGVVGLDVDAEPDDVVRHAGRLPRGGDGYWVVVTVAVLVIELIGRRERIVDDRLVGEGERRCPAGIVDRRSRAG